MNREGYCIEAGGSWAITCPKCGRAPGAGCGAFGLDIRIAQPPKTGHEAFKPLIPSDAKIRKDAPIARGVLGYFPKAMFAVAEVSRVGNEQHNPGQPMHWARGKSTDHADCIVRHLIEAGTLDTDGLRHSAKVAWRALALLETELEAAQAASSAPLTGQEAADLGVRTQSASKF